MFERDEDAMSYNFTFADSWVQNINNIACAIKNNQSQVELKEISPGLSGSFEYGSIGKIKLEIPEMANGSDNIINLISQEVLEYTDYRDGKKYVQVVYKSVSGKYRVLLNIAPEKKDEFLNIINTPSSTFFTNLCNNIPSQESKEAYSKLGQLPVCSYEEISISNRIKYFEWLSGENWTNKDQEKIMLDLLTHVRNREELYDELYKRPALLAKMMLSCDGDSRQLFINEITKLCDENWINGITAKGNVYVGAVPSSFGSFYSGNDFITYAILSEGNNSCSVSNYIGRFPNGMFDWGNVQMLKQLGNFSCNLLDPVEIISSDGSHGLFPLIYPVNSSQQHGNQQVGQQFAATLNYIGVTSSIRILATGSKLARSVAFVELTKTGVEVIFNNPAVIETLNQTEDGKEFLKYWQIASVTIDITTIGTDVLESLAKHGPEASKALRVAGKNDAADNIDELVAEARALNKLGANEIADLMKRFDVLTTSEAKDLFNKLSKTEIKYSSNVIRSQPDILKELSANPNGMNPYNFAFDIEDMVLSQEAVFVRVHRANNPNRTWLIAVEDFKRFTSQDNMIKELALPILDDAGNTMKPTELSLVKLPVGTKVRKSVVRPQDWPGQGHLPGGSVQYEIRDVDLRTKEDWFRSAGSLDNFIK